MQINTNKDSLVLLEYLSVTFPAWTPVCSSLFYLVSQHVIFRNNEGANEYDLT